MADPIDVKINGLRKDMRAIRLLAPEDRAQRLQEMQANLAELSASMRGTLDELHNIQPRLGMKDEKPDDMQRARELTHTYTNALQLLSLQHEINGGVSVSPR